MATPAAIEASKTLRLVGIECLPGLKQRAFRCGMWRCCLRLKNERSRVAAQGPLSCAERAADLGYQLGNRTRAVEPQHGAGQRREPGLVLGEVAAFAGAVLVVRGPFDEALRLLVTPAAGRNHLSAEMRRLALT